MSDPVCTIVSLVSYLILLAKREAALGVSRLPTSFYPMAQKQTAAVALARTASFAIQHITIHPACLALL